MSPLICRLTGKLSKAVKKIVMAGGVREDRRSALSPPSDPHSTILESGMDQPPFLVLPHGICASTLFNRAFAACFHLHLISA
jgi:hypothetical protein